MSKYENNRSRIAFQSVLSEKGIDFPFNNRQLTTYEIATYKIAGYKVTTYKFTTY
jgi:hypothetical protein